MLKIQKGLVSYQGNNDIDCLFGVTDDGKQYYFIDPTDERKLKNGARIATTELVEAIDPNYRRKDGETYHFGIIGEDGTEIIPFVNKAVKPVNDDIVLVVPSKPVSQTVIDANVMRSDPLSATKLVSTPALIKEKLNAKMGNDGRYVFNDQFSEATVCDINGNNLINGEYYSFIGLNNNKLYFSKNTAESEVTEYSLLPTEVQSNVAPITDGSDIDVSAVDVSTDVVEGALNNASSNEGFTGDEVPPISLEDDQVVGDAQTEVQPIAPSEGNLTGMFADPAEYSNDGSSMFADSDEETSKESVTPETVADTQEGIEAEVESSEASDEKVLENVQAPAPFADFAIPTVAGNAQAGDESVAADIENNMPEISEDEEETTDTDVENNIPEISEDEEATTEETIEETKEEVSEEEKEEVSEEIIPTKEETEDKESEEVIPATDETTEEAKEEVSEEVIPTKEETEDKESEEVIPATDETTEEAKEEVSEEVIPTKETVKEETKEEIEEIPFAEEIVKPAEEEKEAIEEDKDIELDDNVENSDLDNLFDGASEFDKDQAEDGIFKNSSVRADSIEDFDEDIDSIGGFDDRYTSVGYREVSVPSNGNIMNDVAKSLTGLIKQVKELKAANRELEALNSDKDEKIQKLASSRKNYIEKIKAYEQKTELLDSKLRSSENANARLESKVQMLEEVNRQKDRTINAQARELEGQDDLKRLVADASVLLSDDSSYGEDSYYRKAM